MNDSLVPTGVGDADDWSFWDIVYGDPELVGWDLPADPAIQQQAAA